MHPITVVKKFENFCFKESLKMILIQQQQKMNNPILKMGKRLKSAFLQIRYTNGKAPEKMFNITKYYRNENQNHNEIPHHAY